MLKGVQLSLLMGDALGAPVPREIVEALTSAQITVTAGQRSGFQLTFTLGKRSVLQTTYLPAGFFDPPRRLILVATVSGNPEVLIDGIITRHEVNASNDPGQSILTVTGEDLSALMDMVDLSGLIRYPGMPAEVRVLLCLAKYAAFGIVPAVIPSVIVNITNPLDKMDGHQGTDFQYIRMLAEMVGYVFYIEPGPRPGMSIAYWGPEVKVGLPQPALTVNSDAHSNVEAMTFSFEGMQKTLFIYYVQNEQTNVSFPIPLPDITPLNPPLGPKVPMPLRTEFLNTPPSPEERARELRLQQLEIAEEKTSATSKMSPAQATLIAMAKASRSADVVQASGSLNVVRYGRPLRARQLVGVRGAGLTYDGFYYVKSVTHNLKRGEYKQSFSLSRNALLPWGGKVPV
jgi:hypothetical protein